MGGRGSNFGGGAQTPAPAPAPAQTRNFNSNEIKLLEKQIDKKGFQNVGNGVWELVGPEKASSIGAQILDETDSAAGGYGMMKAYSVTTWGQAPGDMSPRRVFGSLNAAKTAAKEEMKEWLKSYKVKP